MAEFGGHMACHCLPVGSCTGVLWRGRMPRGRWIGAVWLLLIVMLAQTACRVGPFGTAQVTIQGVVDGEQASAIEQGNVVLVGIAQATVTCNDQQTTTAQDGSYALTVDQANKYACTV